MKIRSNIAICWLFIVWGADFFLLYVLPFRSQYGNGLLCTLLSVLFLLTVAIGALVGLSFFQAHKYRFGKRGKAISMKLLKKLIKLFAILPIIGILLVLYDRIVIRGIDYSQGLRAARYQWLNSQGGSLISVAGNLLVPFSYCTLFFAMYHWERLDKRTRTIGLGSGIFSPVCQALINGGRSNILIVALFILSLLVCRYCGKKKFIPKMKHSSIKIIFAGAVMFVAVFTVFLSSATGNSLKQYTVALVEMNGGEVEQTYIENDDNIIVDIAMLFSSYLFHGQWRFEQIIAIDKEERIGDDLILPALVILKRLHLYHGEIVNPPMLAGNFLNLPASIYYSYGYFGLLSGGILIGLIFGRALYHLSHFKYVDGMTLIFVIMMLMLLYSSCICIIFGFAYFIFVVYAFVAADLFVRFFFGKKSWVLIEEL